MNYVQFCFPVSIKVLDHKAAMAVVWLVFAAQTFLGPLSESVLKSTLIKNYIFVDVFRATAKLVNELGGEVDKVIPESLTLIATILSRRSNRLNNCGNRLIKKFFPLQ